MNPSRLNIKQYTDGILSGNRVLLAKSITLIESSRPEDIETAHSVIESVISHTGKSIRIGITGVPGVGKSTFIESFGKMVTASGKKIAVLTIDPSSQLTKGSILGDKTRMEELSKDPLAFIRPSASRSTLGGVAHKTRETILLCEAAGFEVIIVETVGVGQSEVAVKEMVDFFLLLMLAGAGDELQGIKKGIMEMADAIAITKADGENILKAKEAQADYQHALHLSSVKNSGWTPVVKTCSALTKNGIEDVWQIIQQYQQHTTANGFFESNRRAQRASWFKEFYEYLLLSDFQNTVLIKENFQSLKQDVDNEKLSVQKAARLLIQAYHQEIIHKNS